MLEFRGHAGIVSGLVPQALRDLGTVLAITVPVTLVMGAVLFVFASDNIKKDGDKPPKGE